MTHENLQKINFWKRLTMFVKDVQVNDPMSEEEKEMILRIAKEYIGNCGGNGYEKQPKGQKAGKT